MHCPPWKRCTTRTTEPRWRLRGCDRGHRTVICFTTMLLRETGCPGGPLPIKGGEAGIRALSLAQVDRIVDRFCALNPYDPEVARGSILKVETDNFDPETGKRRQLHCVAISAKRYALFTLSKGEPTIVRRSEHGLGHLL